MAKCSLLIIEGVPPKRLHGYETDIGERAGVKFIKLLHNTGPGTGEKQVRGFQGARIVESENEQTGRITRNFEWSMKDGKPCPVVRNLVFHKDNDTGELVAYVPDTEFNRKVLRVTYEAGSEWKIVDPTIAKEVRAEYDKVAKERAEVETKDQTIARLAEEKRQRDELIEKLKKEKETDSKQNKVVTTAKNLTKIREKLLEEVKAEKGDLIEKLKLEGKSYWLTTAYKEEVLKEVERRVQEIVDANTAKSHNDDR